MTSISRLNSSSNAIGKINIDVQGIKNISPNKSYNTFANLNINSPESQVYEEPNYVSDSEVEKNDTTIMTTSGNFSYQNTNLITNEQLKEAGQEITKILNTLSMARYAFEDGLDKFVGNNIVGLGALIGNGDEAIDHVEGMSEKWGSVFAENGNLSDINQNSYIEYGDETWDTLSGLGHVTAIGVSRYLLSELPEFSNFLTFLDGMGMSYRDSRANGTNIDVATSIGALYGTAETLSFAFPGIGTNFAIGLAMQPLESLLTALANPETNSDNLLDIWLEEYNESGGFRGNAITAITYAINGWAGQVNGNSSLSTEITTDLFTQISNFDMLKYGVKEILDTPFVTTTFNYILHIIADILTNN